MFLWDLLFRRLSSRAQLLVIVVPFTICVLWFLGTILLHLL